MALLLNSFKWTMVCLYLKFIRRHKDGNCGRIIMPRTVCGKWVYSFYSDVENTQTDLFYNIDRFRKWFYYCIVVCPPDVYLPGISPIRKDHLIPLPIPYNIFFFILQKAYLDHIYQIYGILRTNTNKCYQRLFSRSSNEIFCKEI